MIEYLTSILGSEFMLIQSLSLLLIIILSGKKFLDLFLREDLPRSRIATGLNAILFWGGISVLIGFISHFWGISAAYQRISYAHEISPAIIAGGYSKSLITISFGILILLFASIVWFVLRTRYKYLISKRDE